jgi:hypothetical protein
MKKLLLTAFAFICCLSLAQAQSSDADFLHKIKPENRVDLSAQKIEKPILNNEKSTEVLKKELKHLATQKREIEKEIEKMEVANTPKQDNMFVKMQLSLKRVNAQIAESEKLISLKETKNKQ